MDIGYVLFPTARNAHENKTADTKTKHYGKALANKNQATTGKSMKGDEEQRGQENVLSSGALSPEHTERADFRGVNAPPFISNPQLLANPHF